MPDITGSIRTKKVGETGITEDHLREDFPHPGRYRMAIVELVVEMPHGPDAEGNRKVEYRITGLEPVPEDQEERVRTYQRELYRTRPEQAGQGVLTGADEPDTESALGDMTSGLPEDDDTPEEAQAKTAGKGTAKAAPAAAFSASGGLDGEADECPVAECTLPAFHDGDHNAPTPEPSGAPA